MRTLFTLLFLATVPSFASTVPCNPVADITFYSGSTDCSSGLFYDQSQFVVTHSSTFTDAVISLNSVDLTNGGENFLDHDQLTTNPTVQLDHNQSWVDMKGVVTETGGKMDTVYLNNVQSSGVRIFETVCASSFAANFGQCPIGDILATVTAGSGQWESAKFVRPASTVYFDKFFQFDDAYLTKFDNGFGDSAPEPATFALIGSALVGLAFIRRKRTS